MKVSQVARNLGVSPDTIRYYTRIGLLHPNYSSNGYKSYSAGDISRLRFVLRAKMLGFCLSDIKSIFEISERGEVPCPLAREIILKNLNRLGQSIEESVTLYRRMEQAVKVWEDMPNQAPDGHTVCTLIEDWESEVSNERK